MEPDKKTNGALVGAIIIIVLLLLGGAYVWQTNTEDTQPVITPEDAADLEALEEDLDGASVDIEANVIDSVE